MIRSMTGFGRHEGAHSNTTLVVEARSVNHRFLEIAARLPRTFSELEDPFKKAVQQCCRRGRVDIALSYHSSKNGSRTVLLDHALAKQYHQQLGKLKKTLKIGGTVDLALLAGFREIVTVAESVDPDPQLSRLALRLLAHALDDLDHMKRREGAALAKAIQHHLEAIQRAKALVAGKAPTLAAEAFTRMKTRVEKLMGTEVPDLARLNQELAVFADRYDITEELVRLDSHVVQFERTLKSQEAVGKTLDFLLQEFGREVNTIGSKSNDAEITNQVVQMKAELEKIREQVQNVE